MDLSQKEFMEEYRKINKAAWAAFERGEVTKEKLVNQRFEVFFEQLGKSVDGAEAEGCTGTSWTVQRF